MTMGATGATTTTATTTTATTTTATTTRYGHDHDGHDHDGHDHDGHDHGGYGHDHDGHDHDHGHDGDAHWQSAGWTQLGQSWVDGHRDIDTIQLGAHGKFRKLTVVVERSDLEMSGIKITFGNGEVYQPPVRQYFRASSRTRVIDVPGRVRRIRSIEFHYANLAGGGRALVSVFAR